MMLSAFDERLHLSAKWFRRPLIFRKYFLMLLLPFDAIDEAKLNRKPRSDFTARLK